MSYDIPPNIVVFCDFENVAIGVRDARYAGFDIHLVLERLLDKGKVIVKRAYSDWSRYRDAKKPLHEAGFELIEVPHVRYSGKNSADIRMVVDALDICHTKEHIDIFALITGDSDFSPLVSKLRENNKLVVGIGVKNSTSDLLVESCDEFIYYDDLVRERSAEETARKAKRRRRGGRKKEGAAAAPGAAPPEEEGAEDEVDKRVEAIDLVVATAEALLRESDTNVWGSMVKQTLKRKRPHFNESFHGYRSFNHLLEDARDRGHLAMTKDERSGGYVISEARADP